MADWGRTLEEILDGMTLPQFRLLSKMRVRRVLENRRWDLQLASFSIQTKEQGEALTEMMETLSEIEAEGQEQSEMRGALTASSRYPLLHELTPTQVAGDRQLRRIVRFHTIKDDSSG